jgi:CRP/FNR family transcriptional regulator
LHIVISGLIEVFKTNKKGKVISLKKFSPFSFVAEVSNYNHIPFPASAKAKQASTILLIDYIEFEKKLLYLPTVAPLVLKSIANKVIALEKLISENLILDAKQRIVKFIYENENALLTQKHNKIACSLNITPVTFSRILKKLKEDNIISLDNHIVDKEYLKKEFS